jgi:hypothetical protein
MVKIEESKKMEKIQIYPSKQQHGGFSSKSNKPKLIMSPLTTMPSAKKMMIAASALPMKPIMMTTNEHSAKMPMKVINAAAPILTHAVKLIPLSDNKRPLDGTDGTQSKTAATVDVKMSAARKETAGCRSEKQQITLVDVHPYITCFLCKGYLIEATTIVECLHTYCHSCLMKHLSREKCCPQCDMSINKSKTNIK